MNKIKITESYTRGRLIVEKALQLLLAEVLSAGGDGDAVWVIRYYDIYDMHAFINLVIKNNDKYWDISEVLDDKRFIISNNQESLVITTDEKDIPPWSQCVLYLG